MDREALGLLGVRVPGPHVGPVVHRDRCVSEEPVRGLGRWVCQDPASWEGERWVASRRLEAGGVPRFLITSQELASTPSKIQARSSERTPTSQIGVLSLKVSRLKSRRWEAAQARDRQGEGRIWTGRGFHGAEWILLIFLCR